MAEEKEPEQLGEKLTLEQQIKDAENACLEYEKNAGKEESELAQERREQQDQLRLLKGRTEVQQVIKDVRARRLLYRIIELGGGPYNTTFTPGDPYMSAFNEGRRYVAAKIQQILIDADGGIYWQMLREHASDLKAEQDRKKKENPNG